MVVRKGQLARELGIGVESIGRAVRDGMPLRWDGRIDRGVALAWLRAHGTTVPRGCGKRRLRPASWSARLKDQREAKMSCSMDMHAMGWMMGGMGLLGLLLLVLLVLGVAALVKYLRK